MQNDLAAQRLRASRALMHRNDLEVLFDAPASREKAAQVQQAGYVLHEGGLLNKYRDEEVGV